MYSQSGKGFSFLHGVVVIGEKHGYVNLSRLIAENHLKSSWSSQHNGVYFELSIQKLVDGVIPEDRDRVNSGLNIRVPVAIPVPKGRPPKNCSKILRSWNEKGSSEKKRGNMTVPYVDCM